MTPGVLKGGWSENGMNSHHHPSFRSHHNSLSLESNVVVVAADAAALHPESSLYACVSPLSLALRDSPSLSVKDLASTTRDLICSRLTRFKESCRNDWQTCMGNEQGEALNALCGYSLRISHDWVTDRLPRPAAGPPACFNRNWIDMTLTPHWVTE